MRLLLALTAATTLLVAGDAAWAQFRIGPEGPKAVSRPGQAEIGQPAWQTIVLDRNQRAEVRIPSPPLIYRFDFLPDEQVEGNSVPYFYRALLELKSVPRDDVDRMTELQDHADEQPVDNLDVAEAEEVLSRFSDVFREIDRAVVRSETDWSWPDPQLLAPELFMFTLGESQEARTIARLLDLKARVEIRRGDYPAAVKTLRKNYALGRIAAKPPLLITRLIGMAICSVAEKTTRDMIARPDCPNMYWAAASLPTPLIDLRSSVEFEVSLADRFEGLSTEALDHWSDEELQKTLVKLVASLDGLEAEVSTPFDIGPELMSVIFALRAYDGGKQFLISQGHSAEEVERMGVAEVLLRHEKQYVEMRRQEALSGYMLEGRSRMAIFDRLERSLRDDNALKPGPSSLREPLPIAATLFPAIRQCVNAENRMEARIAGLRVIEAVRAHFAETGELPQSLAEIEVVPAPDNPRTGEPFDYRVEDGRAELLLDVSEHAAVNTIVTFEVK